MPARSDTRSVVVIGGGIVGLSIALQLLLDGLKVTLVESDGIMEGVSRGNAGYLSEANLFPPAAPDMLRQLPRLLFSSSGPLVIRAAYLGKMLPWGIHALAAGRSTARGEIVHAMGSLIRPALSAFDDLTATAHAAHLISRQGGLVAFRTEAALTQRAGAIPVWREQGIAVEQLNGQAVLELEPHLTRDIFGGIYFPNAGRCSDPRALGIHYARFLFANGGRIVPGRVDRISTSQREVSVHLASGTIAASKVVIAAGLGSSALLKQLGHRCPMVSERGYHLMLPNSGGLLSRPIVFGEPFFAATPMDGGLRLAGTAEFAAVNARPNMRRAHMLLKQCVPYLPDVEGEDAAAWMGCRPSLPDGMPAIGCLPGDDRIVYAFGHGHNGLTTSAITAKCVAALLRGTPTPVDLAPFGLERFALTR